MSRYDATDDPLCYAGTSILKNKADLQDQEELDQFEQLMFFTRADEPLPGGVLDFEHYKRIHHHLFQDIYDWAGSPRGIRTAKGGNWFCYPEYIDAEMEKLFTQLAEEDHLTEISSPQQFATQAAHYISEINAIHPFREGNGRCQLTFLNILLDISGFQMNEDNIDPEQFMEAMIASFHGNNNPLAREILKIMS